jgi:non-ribosomal peptide synthetase component E (peptide arylation enzyme)
MHWSELIARNAVSYPNEVAFSRGKQKLIFREVDERANQAANGLAKAGITRGAPGGYFFPITPLSMSRGSLVCGYCFL